MASLTTKIMNNLPQKLRYIYLPFALVSIGFLVVYSLINYVFIIRLEWIRIDSFVIEFIAPFVLSYACVYYLLRNSIKQLVIKNPTNDYFRLYLVIAIMVCAPCIPAQLYLSTATGKLTTLQKSSQIYQLPPTKYYRIQQLVLNKSKTTFYNSIDVSGKHNQYLNFKIYCTLPILDKAQDSTSNNTSVYLGYVFQKQISNRLSDAEKESAYKRFLRDSQHQFDSIDYTKYNYLERLTKQISTKGYYSAMNQNSHFSLNEKVVLIRHQTPFEERNGSTLKWMFILLTVMNVVFLIIVLLSGYAVVKGKDKRKAVDVFQSDFYYLIPKKNYYVTPIIANLNILLFLLMVFKGYGFMTLDFEALYSWGALNEALIKDRQWWRLLTSLFLHNGIIHLVVNMISLLGVGYFLEPIIKTNKLLLFYLLCGIGGGIAGLVWHGALTVGASGAIFGLYGILLTLLLFKAVVRSISKPLWILTLLFILYNVTMGIINPNTDNAGHIGGLLTGILIGAIISSTIEEENKSEKEER